MYHVNNNNSSLSVINTFLHPDPSSGFCFTRFKTNARDAGSAKVFTVGAGVTTVFVQRESYNHSFANNTFTFQYFQIRVLNRIRINQNLLLFIIIKDNK